MHRGGNLLDLKSFSQRDQRQEPGEVTIERNLGHRRPPHGPNTTGNVPQLAAREVPNERVKNPTLDAIHQRVAAGGAARDRQVGASTDPINQCREHRRVSLRVCGYGEDDRRGRGAGRCLEQRGLAQCLSDLEHPDRLALCGQLGKRRRQTPKPRIGREDHFEGEPGRAERRRDLAVQLDQRARPLDHGHDDRDVGTARRHGRRSTARGGSISLLLRAR